MAKITIDRKSEELIVVKLSSAKFGITKLRITNSDDFRGIKVTEDTFQKGRVLFRRGNRNDSN